MSRITIKSLTARLDIAKEVFRNQRTEIGALKAEIEALKTQLDALGTQPLRQPLRQKAQPVVTQFTKADGSVWVKERTGNTARIYQAH